MLGVHDAARSSGKALKVEVQMDLDYVLQKNGPFGVLQGAVPGSKKGYFVPPGMESDRSTLSP